MIVGVMPGIFPRSSEVLFAKSAISLGRDDLGSPFDKAAAAILAGRRLVIREWKIALSVSAINYAILDRWPHDLGLHNATAIATPRILIPAIRPLAIALKRFRFQLKKTAFVPLTCTPQER